MTFEAWFQAAHAKIPFPGAAAVLRLAADGATVPFIARYRKEQTGNLDEVQVQAVLDAKARYDGVVDRQGYILKEVERQRKLTPELKQRILASFDPRALEDLFLPYKPKKKSRALAAREAGLQPLADWIWDCGHGSEQPQSGQTLELWAFTFRNEEKGYKDVEAVIQGAQDILIERLAETVELRQRVRDEAFGKGFLRAAKGDKPKPASKYEKYFDHAESVESLLKPEHSHRYLAMRRGAAEGELQLSLAGGAKDPEFGARLLAAFEAAAMSLSDSPGTEVLRRAAKVALKSHVLPAIETEVHRALKEVADDVAIAVFAENLRGLLMASPFGPKAVIGVDPGLRSGCKLAVVDAAGAYLASHVLRLQNEEGESAAKKLLAEVLKAAEIRAIAVGNGTGGREAESFLRAAVKQTGFETPVVMVSEAGASVYSASGVAREEFPELDLTVRGAISIARRLQDPLAELVKIEPKSIGVGQYQHDVPPAALKRGLEQVVDSCVNQVGVNLNTASTHLLAHVSGIGPALAKAIVEQRVSKGLFRSRASLMDVPRFSSKTFEQAAGFLRVPGGDQPLDATGVHPERYPVLEACAARLGKELKDLLASGVELLRGDAVLEQELGPYTFDDIVRELEKPGRDPREEFSPFAYRDDVHELKDLKPGMVCPGIVTNVTNFGAFVDIGVHQDGLVHVSQLSDKFVRDPKEVVHPGQRVSVRVLTVALEKGQISLTMKSPPPERKPRPRRPPRPARKPEARAHERPPGPKPAGPNPRPAAPPPRPGPPASGPPNPPRAAKPQPKPKAPPAPRGFANNPFAVLADLKDKLKRS